MEHIADSNKCDWCAKLANELRQCRKGYEQVLDNLQDVCYRWSMVSKSYDYLSPSVEKILGYSREELYGYSFEQIAELIHPEDRPAARSRFEQAVRDGVETVYDQEYRCRRKDGNFIWVAENLSIVFDENRTAIAFVGVMRDISEKKRLFIELAEKEQLYRDLYDNANVALYRVRIEDGKMLECNRTLAEMIGYSSREECIAKHFSPNGYVNPERRKEFLKKLRQYGSLSNWEIHGRKEEGAEFWVSLSARIYPEQGFIEGAMVDITYRKLLSAAELEVLRHIIEGMSNSQIAEHLFKSIRTVEDQRASIMRKLGTHNSIELTKRAVQMGLVS
jgi:PAS domain S-box-containing protein